MTRHPSMPAGNLQVVEYAGKQLVSGLYWKPLESVRSYMAEAKRIGRLENMDMVAIRKNRTIIQAGFAPKGNKRLKGMYSFAAALAGQLGENWLGAFKVDDTRYAFVAVNNGGIMPGRDFIGSFDEVHTQLVETYGILSEAGVKLTVYAAPEFEYSDDHLELADVLTAKAIRAEYRLKPLTFGLTKRELAFIGAGLAAILAAGAGVKWWLDAQKQAEAAATQQAALLAKAQADALAKANVVHPWTQAPAVGALLEACAAHLRAAPLSIAGWQFDNARCAQGKAVAIYKRNDTTPAAAFAAAASRRGSGLPAMLEQGTAGAIESRIAVSVESGDTLPETGALLLRLTSHFQALGEGVAALTVTEKPYTPDPEKPDALPPDWTTNAFQITTKLPPTRLFEGFDTSGIRVFEVATALDTKTAELTWTLTGEMYGR